MFRRTILSCSLPLLLVSLLPLSTAQADGHAEEVFRQCQEDLEHLTRRCVRANFELAEDCIRRIRRLLQEGQIEEAVHLARRCINRIEEQTVLCLRDMSALCHRCVRVLRELGAPRLAERFRANCVEAGQTVIKSARRSIREIEGQFKDR